jgi:hypothetical protein
MYSHMFLISHLRSAQVLMWFNCLILGQRSMQSRQKARRLLQRMSEAKFTWRTSISVTRRDLVLECRVVYRPKYSQGHTSPWLARVVRARVPCKSAFALSGRLVLTCCIQDPADRAVLRSIVGTNIRTWRCIAYQYVIIN